MLVVRTSYTNMDLYVYDNVIIYSRYINTWHMEDISV